jgi:predicted NACHT family NTPase
MNDLILDATIKELSKLIFTITKSIGGSLRNLTKSEGKNLDNLFYKISSKYVERFYHRYGYLQVMGMHEPMLLENVFVDIQTLDTIGQHKYLSIDKLTETFQKRNTGIRNLQDQEIFKIDGIRVAQNESRLMVVGAPGGGKSTYLRKIGITCLSSNNQTLKNFLPILIELKNIDETHDMDDLILNELQIAEFPYPAEFLKKALQQGKLLILFDGLDEVPTNLEDQTLRKIKDFCDQYYKNRFIVSCRIAAYKGGLNNFKNVEIANLDKNQIEKFIEKWFKEKNHGDNKKDASIKCWEKINSPEYMATLELAQTPLLLTLLCLVFYYQQDFPKNRSLLYREAINVLLKEWNAAKRIHSNSVYQDMTLPFEELLLSHIAHHYFLRNEYFFDKSELSTFISEYINNNLNAPKFLDGSKILEAISIQQGILVERAKNIYSFSHLTFQEYFTAKYLDDHGLTEQYISEYLFNPKWREIFILLCGIMKAGSDKLLNAIYVNCNEQIHSNRDFENYKTIDIRILNLFITLLFGTNFSLLGSLKMLESLLKEINPLLYKQVTHSWIIDHKPNAEIHFTLYLELANLLKTKSKVMEVLEKCLLDYSEHKSLRNLRNSFCNYLGGNFEFNEETVKIIAACSNNLDLLYQCKKSSILVTKNNWHNIESGILTCK